MEAQLSDLGLLAIQASALFVHDERGRLRTVNEPEPEPRAAPRFCWGRARAGSLLRFRYDLPKSMVQRLTEIVAAEPPDAELTEMPQGLAAVRAILEAQAPIREAFHGPAYRFPAHVERPTSVVAITQANQHLLRLHFTWLLPRLEAHQPCCAIVVDGSAVSVCNAGRSTARAAEAGLETVAAYRERGYGPQVTAAWALAVREQGRVPLYSTWWRNEASRAVARKLGLIQYADDLHFT